MEPIYKVHDNDLKTGNNYLIFKSENEEETRKFFDNEKVIPGKEKQLSVVFSGSTTLLDWK